MVEIGMHMNKKLLGDKNSISAMSLWSLIYSEHSGCPLRVWHFSDKPLIIGEWVAIQVTRAPWGSRVMG